MVYDKFLCFLAHFQEDTAIGKVLLQESHLDVHDRNEVFLREGSEHNLFVHAVQEFRREHALDFFANGGFHAFVIVGLAHLGKAHATAMADFTSTGVTRHDDNRILEVDLAAIAIRQNAIVQNLEEQVVNVRMRLFNFIEQHHRIRMLANLFAQLTTTIFKAHISRRSANQAAYAMLFHVFAHVDTHKRIFATEKFLAKHLREFRLTHTRRAQEEEAAHRALVVANACTATADGFHNRIDSLILTNHALLDFITEVDELLRFFATESADRDARHLADDVTDNVVIDNRRFGLFALQLLFAFGNAILQFFFAGAKLCRRSVILVGDSLFLFLEAFAKLVFHVLQILRNLDGIQAHACARFIEHVNGLVRQEAFADVAFTKFNGSTHSIRRITHIVMLFILRAEAIENLDRIFDRRRIHDNRLETAFKSRILLDVLAVFVKSRSANALEFTTCKGGLKDVRSIEAAFRAACPHNRVEFIDKENHGIANALEFHDEALHAFFELATILCTSHHSSNVKRHNALVRKQIRNLALYNLESQTFDNRSLTYARFANERRVVLFATAKNLDQAFNFCFTADNRVELACASHRREVTTEVFENRSLGTGLRIRLARLRIAFTRFIIRLLTVIHRLSVSLALDLHQHFLIVFKRHVVCRECRCRRGIRLLQNGKHQMFGANELDALFLGNLCCIVKHSLALRRKSQKAAVGIATDRHEATVRTQRTLNRLAEFCQVDLQSLERFRGNTRILANKTKQKVFYRYAVAP